MSSLLFADDFVRLTETEPALQRRIDIVYNYNNRCCFESSIKKCTVVNFSIVREGTGMLLRCHQDIPNLDSYCYLRVEFSSIG